MKKIIIILLMLIGIANAKVTTNYIMSDYDFTNTKAYPDWVYLHAYTNDFKDYEIRYIIQVYSDYQLNPILAFMTISKEGRPKDNYMMGCASHYEIPNHITKHKGFYSQVVMSAQTYHHWFTNAQANKYKVVIFDDNRSHKVSNKATFSLYMYTPHFRHYIYGDWHGNFYVPAIFNQVIKKLEVVK